MRSIPLFELVWFCGLSLSVLDFRVFCVRTHGSQMSEKANSVHISSGLEEQSLPLFTLGRGGCAACAAQAESGARPAVQCHLVPWARTCSCPWWHLSVTGTIAWYTPCDPSSFLAGVSASSQCPGSRGLTSISRSLHDPVPGLGYIHHLSSNPHK